MGGRTHNHCESGLTGRDRVTGRAFIGSSRDSAPLPGSCHSVVRALLSPFVWSIPGLSLGSRGRRDPNANASVGPSGSGARATGVEAIRPYVVPESAAWLWLGEGVSGVDEAG